MLARSQDIFQRNAARRRKSAEATSTATKNKPPSSTLTGAGGSASSPLPGRSRNATATLLPPRTAPPAYARRNTMDAAINENGAVRLLPLAPGGQSDRRRRLSSYVRKVASHRTSGTNEAALASDTVERPANDEGGTVPRPTSRALSGEGTAGGAERRESGVAAAAKRVALWRRRQGEAETARTEVKCTNHSSAIIGVTLFVYC